MGMIEERENTGFAFKTSGNAIHCFSAKCFSPYDLDGDIPFQSHVAGFVDCCHATLAQRFKDLVSAEGFSSEVEQIMLPGGD